MDANDESNVTDIELLPDGRICVFGTSLEVLAVLSDVQQGRDAVINRRLDASACRADQEVEKTHTDRRRHE